MTLKDVTSAKRNTCKLFNKESKFYSELAQNYDLDSCIEWIKTNNFEKVCLQFPESLLIDSVDISAYIENDLKRKVYILGDTAYGSLIMSEIVFKEPKEPVRRIEKKKKVLDEDSYLDKMGKIIERDFFPDLKKLVAQNDYLDAVEKNDVIKLREIYAKYTRETPATGNPCYSSPATFETPVDCRPSEDSVLRDGSTSQRTDDVDKSEDGNNVNKSMSLNQYLAHYTSEDNQSFEDIIKESEIQNKQKQPWLFKEERSNAEALALTDKEQPHQLDTWGYKNKNYIMYVPDGIQSDEPVASQEIIHTNTRFDGSPWDESQSKERIKGLAQQQVKILDGKIGVDGKELVGASPRIAGYGLVKTPSPAPGVSDSPLMTWGEIEGTPFRLDAGDRTPGPCVGPSFRIPEPPRREKLAHALADKHTSDRQRKKRAMETAKRSLSQSPCDRLGNMSPAARRLATTQLKKVLGTTDKALLASYSPRNTPHSRLSTSSTPRSNSSGNTPSLPVTTDNLLNINIPNLRDRSLT